MKRTLKIRPQWGLFLALSVILISNSCKSKKFDFASAYKFSTVKVSPSVKENYSNEDTLVQNLSEFLESPDGIEKEYNSENDLRTNYEPSIDIDSIEKSENYYEVKGTYWSKDANGVFVDTKRLGIWSFIATNLSVLSLLTIAGLGFTALGVIIGGFGMVLSFTLGVKAFTHDRANRRIFRDLGKTVKFSAWPKIGFFYSLFWFALLAAMGVAYLFVLLILSII